MKLSAKAQASMDKVIQKFKEGDLSDIAAITMIQPHPSDDKPFNHWTYSNRIMAYMQTGSMDLRGYRQWQEIGRQVQKGSTAAYILVPLFRTEKDDEGKEEKILYGFKSAAVFPDYMTEGDPLPEFDYSPKDPPPLADVAKRWNIDIAYTPNPNGTTRGSYNPVFDNIKLHTHSERTFFHELAHAAHNRIENLKGGQDARQETIAELSAAILAEIYGMDYTGNAWNYITHYNPDDPLKAILQCLPIVGEILEKILTEEANA